MGTLIILTLIIMNIIFCIIALAEDTMKQRGDNEFNNFMKTLHKKVDTEE